MRRPCPGGIEPHAMGHSSLAGLMDYTKQRLPLQSHPWVWARKFIFGLPYSCTNREACAISCTIHKIAQFLMQFRSKFHYSDQNYVRNCAILRILQEIAQVSLGQFRDLRKNGEPQNFCSSSVLESNINRFWIFCFLVSNHCHIDGLTRDFERTARVTR